VRRICPYCAEDYTPTHEDEERLGIKIQPGKKV
jgi:type IV pilus assembly protein PilB